jgi:hypothetical protein
MVHDDRRRISVTDAMLAAIAFCALAPSTSAQAPSTPSGAGFDVVCRLDADRVTPLTLGRVFRGVENSCFGCHRDAAQQAGAFEVASQPGLSDGWIRNDEVLTWLAEDRHSQAYAVLLTRRSQDMGRLLGVAEIHRDARCVACHSGFPVQSVECPDGLLPAALAADRRVTWGISCEACHGASGDAPVGQDVRQGWKRSMAFTTCVRRWPGRGCASPAMSAMHKTAAS